VPLIGCGGIMDWRDAVEFFLAGATAVQVGTAVMYRDLEVFSDLQKGLGEYLEAKHFDNIAQLVGLACRV